MADDLVGRLSRVGAVVGRLARVRAQEIIEDLGTTAARVAGELRTQLDEPARPGRALPPCLAELARPLVDQLTRLVGAGDAGAGSSGGGR